MAKFKYVFAAALLSISFTGLSARADDSNVETELVDALNKVFGAYPGMRAAHSKGIVAEGSFKASPEAQTLSRAEIFNGGTYPVTVRFSDSTGLPNVPDGSAPANPHGLAIKFHLPDGIETDMVTNSLKFFPVSSGADFRDFLLAVAASPANAPKPTKLEQFLAAHPSVAAASATPQTPASFATDDYHGIHAFILVNKAGEKQAVRYIILPEKGEHLSAAEAAQKAPDFLMDELPKRLAAGPVTFHLKAQLAAPGDPTSDASKPWPDDRKIVDLGVLTISKPVADSAEAQKQLLFLPGQVIDGIEVSDDPLINVRDGAYAISYSRRNP